MTMSEIRPLIVAGTGPAGLIAALAFARAGMPVLLAGPEANGEDARTTALMGPSLSFLQGLGVADEVEAGAAPLATMRIIDATARLVRARPVTFRAEEIGEARFGLNIPNAHLNRTLKSAVEAEPGIEWRREMVASWSLSPACATATLAGGDEVPALLCVAADGRGSPARQAAGIATSRRELPQAALVVNFAHARDHGAVSTEFHTETGPFTQVPLPGRRSSLVWVERPATADRLVAMTDDELSLEIERRMQSMLGRVSVEPGRQVHRLASVLPSRFGGSRVALVGEAAHVFAPIGAQGLNLGIRDIEALVGVAEAHRGDPGAPEAIARYDRLRRPDILARSGAVGLLNRSLLSDMLPWQLLRSSGLGAVGAIAPLRAFLMREGMRPGAGLSGIFARSPEGVGR